MKKARVHPKIDKGTIIGLVLSLAGIVGGLLLEKGSIHDIAQYTAALIVLGGTAGAMLVTSPLPMIRAAFAQLRCVFWENTYHASAHIELLIEFATKARKSGILSLETEADRLSQPFLRKALNLVIDGTDLNELVSTMELEIDLAEYRAEQAAKVFENGGGYAPTIGIIGAVLGLIQVMKNLANLEEVGHGIAVAFVATVYGVALANLLLLPIAGKIRNHSATERQERELLLLGVIGILEGWNPKILRNKLNAYLADQKSVPLRAPAQKLAA